LDKAKKNAGDQQASGEKVRALLAATRRDAAAGKFAEAEVSLKQAEQLQPNSAEVKNARVEFDNRKAAAGKVENEKIGALVGQAKAALAKNDLAAAETAVGAAEKIDAKAPTVVGVRAELDAAKKKATDQRTSAEKVRALLAAVRRDAAAGKFAEAEASLKQAEQLEPNSAEVKNARVELDKQMRADKAGNATPPGGKPAGPATGTGPATTGSTPPAATTPANSNDKATADKVDALVAQARDAIKKRDFKTADTALDQAEKLDAKAPEVIKARAELDAAEPGRRRNRQQQ
jgi:hypothetical protein